MGLSGMVGDCVDRYIERGRVMLQAELQRSLHLQRVSTTVCLYIDIVFIIAEEVLPP